MILAGTSAQAIPSAAAIFCAELERTIEAIELGDTTALQRSRARPPSFGFRTGCGAQGGGWFCQQSLAPDQLSLKGLAEGVSRCRPELLRVPQRWPDAVLFEGSGLRIRIGETGAPRAHVGRIVTFSVEPQAVARPQAR
jgi:hypothetical protein